MHFFLELVGYRKAREAHSYLSLTFLAAQGSGRGVQKQLSALKKQAK